MPQLFNLADDLRRTPERAFLTDDSREIMRFAVETLMSGQEAALVMLTEIRGGAARSWGRRWWCVRMASTVALSRGLRRSGSGV